MIAKGSLKAGFGDTAYYLEYGSKAPGDGEERTAEQLEERRAGRVAWAERRGLVRHEREQIVGEMNAFAAHNGRVEKPAYHLKMS